MKKHRCNTCGKGFKQHASLKQHQDATGHGVAPSLKLSKEGARAVMDDMDDLPDGAFFALAAEMGLEPEDFT